MSKVEDEHFHEEKVEKNFVKKYAKVWLTLSIVSVITAVSFMSLFLWEDQVSFNLQLSLKICFRHAKKAFLCQHLAAQHRNPQPESGTYAEMNTATSSLTCATDSQ